MDNHDDYNVYGSDEEEETDYNVYGSDEEEETNTDRDDYYLDADDGLASDHTVDLKNYTILKEQDIGQRQEKDITEISTLLQINKSAACSLLLHYNWNVSKVHEEWFSDEEKVRNAVGLLVNSDTPKVTGFPSKKKKKKLKCGICFNKFAFKHLRSVGCDHLFCKSCWKSYITTSIGDGPGCLTLRCPGPSCAGAIGRRMVRKFVSKEDKDKYYNFLRRSYVENSRNMIKWCPAPGCDSAVEFVNCGRSCDVTCDCSYGFCWNCTEETHRPVDCETVGKWVMKNNAEAANANWILVNCKPCPNCKRPIQKNEGCNHMTCNICRFEYCWICLGEWSRHGGGSPYKCNRYAAAKNAGIHDKAERMRETAKQSLDRYTHYYGRWGSHSSSMRKALEDLNLMKSVHVQILMDVHGRTELQLKFVLEAWEQIVECRRVLKWTYAYGFYLSEQKLKSKLEFFEHLQGVAESSLERLHHCAENELIGFVTLDKPANDFDSFRKKLSGLTSVTRNYFENLVRALENDLSDVEARKRRRPHETRGSSSRKHKHSRQCSNF